MDRYFGKMDCSLCCVFGRFFAPLPSQFLPAPCPRPPPPPPLPTLRPSRPRAGSCTTRCWPGREPTVRYLPVRELSRPDGGYHTVLFDQDADFGNNAKMLLESVGVPLEGYVAAEVHNVPEHSRGPAPYFNHVHWEGHAILCWHNFARDDLLGGRRAHWSDIMAVSCSRVMARENAPAGRPRRNMANLLAICSRPGDLLTSWRFPHVLANFQCPGDLPDKRCQPGGDRAGQPPRQPAPAPTVPAPAPSAQPRQAHLARRRGRLFLPFWSPTTGKGRLGCSPISPGCLARG